MDLYLSFDDGRKDNYLVSTVLNGYGLCATFHVTTGFIDGSFKTDAFGKGRSALTKEELEFMSKNGFEISSHGDKHIMSTSDFCDSIKKLDAWLGNIKTYGFSVPNSSFTEKELFKFCDENKPYLKYIRVGRNKKCHSFFGKANYCLYHLLHWQCFFNNFNKTNIIFLKDKFFINSLVVKKDSNIKNLINFIKKYENFDCSLVLMFHSVVEKPKDEWEYDYKSFNLLCNYLSNNSKLTIKKLEDF